MITVSSVDVSDHAAVAALLERLPASRVTTGAREAIAAATKDGFLVHWTFAAVRDVQSLRSAINRHLRCGYPPEKERRALSRILARLPVNNGVREELDKSGIVRR